MTHGVFVTGTDTDCGKTRVATQLIRALRATGRRVAGFKPVAAGAVMRDGELQNDDALALRAAAGLESPYEILNPYCFAPPIAPHLAAAEQGVTIELAPIEQAYRRLAAASELVVVEGAGGWLVPIGPDRTMADVALALGLPVVMVVGLRLGCLNHALLTAAAVAASGATLCGWIGSQVDPAMVRLDENLATLDRHLGVPCLGVLANPAAARGPQPPRPLRTDWL